MDAGLIDVTTHRQKGEKARENVTSFSSQVIGLTTYQLPMLQAGSHGSCIAQCKSAKISTKKTIPMQVDGEAIRLNPSDIELTFLNQVHVTTDQ